MVRVDGLGVRFPGAQEATLSEVSFELAPGALAAVLGPSGAGKSTLLRCLMGLEEFERGTIRVDGLELCGSSGGQPRRERDRARREIRARFGLVFQSLELFPHLTVLDNCTLAPRRVLGMSRAEANRRALELLAELGVAEKAHEHPERLSIGQRQRTAIARALAMQPEAVLYDEPTSALDPSLKAEVAQALKRVQARRVTQLVVTHDVQLARAAETVFILAEGRIVERGPAAKVLGAPEHPATRKLLAASGPDGA